MQPPMISPQQQQQMMMPMMLSAPHFMKQDSTLYVGNLNPDMSDEMIHHEFSIFGNLLGCRLMKNAYTKESRCFGYVTYADVLSAQRAQLEMNGKEVCRRELRVHFKRNTKNLNNEANFIIKNIAKTVTSKQLNQECSRFGEIVSCFVRKEEEGNVLQSLGYGYLQFEKVEDANRFLAEFNGRELNGQKVLVEQFVSSKIREKTNCLNLYVKQFPIKWDKDAIEQYLTSEFGKFGEITSKGVYKSNDNRYYAFVAFNKSESAQAALEAMNDFKVEDENLYVSQAQTKSKRKYILKKERMTSHQQTNIYIRSIKLGVTVETITNIFKKYGAITSVCLREWTPSQVNTADPAIPLAQPLQFGFINFQNSECAQNVLLSYKKDPEIKEIVTHENETPFIYFAQPKEVRKQFVSMQKRMKDAYARGNFMTPQAFPQKGYPRKPFKNHPQGQMMNFQGEQQFRPMPNYPQIGMNQMIPTPGSQMQNQLITSLNSSKPTEPLAQSTDYKKIAEELRKTKKEFLQKSLDEQKNFLGNIMYARVRSMQKDEGLIPKITGMLIDMEVLEFEEILEIIEDDKSLKERIEEAIEVINDNVGN